MAAWAARNADATEAHATKPRPGYCAPRGDEGFQRVERQFGSVPLRRALSRYSTTFQLASGLYWAIEAPRAAVFGPRSFW